MWKSKRGTGEKVDNMWWVEGDEESGEVDNSKEGRWGQVVE